MEGSDDIDMNKKKKPKHIILHKQLAMRYPAKIHDIYVTRKYPLIVYYKRAMKLLSDLQLNFIILHGLGICINVAIWVVQDLLQEHPYFLRLENVTTRTVSVIDYVTEHTTPCNDESGNNMFKVKFE
jgi:hypothetical protein